MGNDNFESPGCGGDKQLPTINQGTSSSEKKVLTVNLVDKGTGKPVDLSAASAIVATFPATNNAGFIQKTMLAGIAVVSPGQIGYMAITLDPADVALLTPGVISFTVQVTTPAITGGIIQFLNSIQVNPPPFPGA